MGGLKMSSTIKEALIDARGIAKESAMFDFREITEGKQSRKCKAEQLEARYIELLDEYRETGYDRDHLVMVEFGELIAAWFRETGIPRLAEVRTGNLAREDYEQAHVPCHIYQRLLAAS